MNSFGDYYSFQILRKMQICTAVKCSCNLDCRRASSFKIAVWRSNHSFKCCDCSSKFGRQLYYLSCSFLFLFHFIFGQFSCFGYFKFCSCLDGFIGKCLRLVQLKTLRILFHLCSIFLRMPHF